MSVTKNQTTRWRCCSCSWVCRGGSTGSRVRVCVIISTRGVQTFGGTKVLSHAKAVVSIVSARTSSSFGLTRIPAAVDIPAPTHAMTFEPGAVCESSRAAISPRARAVSSGCCSRSKSKVCMRGVWTQGISFSIRWRLLTKEETRALFRRD